MRSFGPCRSAISASGFRCSLCTARTIARRLRVRLVRAVREVEADRVDARVDELAQLLVRRRMRDRSSRRSSSSGGRSTTACHSSYAAPARGNALQPGIRRLGAQLLLDAQQLVVLRDAVRARGRARLDLPGAERDREVGDRRVLGLARAVRHDRRVAVRSARARTASIVSVSVPIWFTLTRIELPTPRSIPSCRRAGFVTNRSSPTSCTRSPSARSAPATTPSRPRPRRPRSRRPGSGRRSRPRSPASRRSSSRGPRTGRRRPRRPRSSLGRARSRPGRGGPRARRPRGSARSPPRSTRGRARSRPRRRRRVDSPRSVSSFFSEW